ncbi:hypothetical protein Aph02nite_64930 [Actinoplanes philippinensis]|uniref:Uncharacterized protein n=1 Tax=Actinoplanes philippinensis TaxID=35752 RepID=A0A1I2LFN0_9ACTN|nr:hypothetical protein [Actinoplanes philippinensis]GIE80543.1 hypothetical protein Aph02nite_64930 [Actinoplanes philippinensis]SFF77290.1 hypothetical protein SAMN05421541_12182 [Actinoplanes philippinensis]
MTGTRTRRPVPDRARKRAIRALAAQLGVSYSVAARLLADDHRAWIFAAREQRTFHARVTDTRLAVDLPLGRAAHLVRRFPPMRSFGPLYAGEARETVLGMLYAVVLHDSPELLPPAEELAWAAELGEESAVDITCAAVDRAARLLLDADRWRLWARVDAALAVWEPGADRRLRDAAITLGRVLRSTSLRGSVDGARHILDAVLVEPYEGDPPGARVSVDGRTRTVTGVRWERTGPPAGYDLG